MTDLTTLSVAEMASGLRKKNFSSLEIVRQHLDKIQKQNTSLNAFLEVFDDVEVTAKMADDAIAKDPAHTHLLAGIPIATKDNILIKGKTASAASKILANHVATYDATVVAKLRERGVVFMGRTNMDEFAFGSSTEKSAFGPTQNPYAEGYVPGGTSGGSAAAVAAKLVPIALGSDTGGSIRQPASFCGLVGIKPTYGVASRYGLIAAGSSFDQIGALARTIDDAELLLNSFAGYDHHDGTTIPDTERGIEVPLRKKIGIPFKFLENGVDSEILEALEQTKKKLSSAGYAMVDVDMPNIGYSLAAYYVLIFAEESSNLSRFDGMRYGLHAEGETLFSEYAKSRALGFGDEAKRRIILGTYVLSAGYYDAYYRRANALRGAILSDFKKAFDSVDAIMMPTSPILPFKIGEKNNDPLAMYLADIFTVSPNLTGLPAISVPAGFSKKTEKSLPIGMQFVGPRLTEKNLFEIGREAITEI